MTLLKTLSTALLAVLLLACSSEPSSPEAQIKAVIAQMEDAAEGRNRRGLSEHISDSYSDEHGNKDSLNNIFRAYLLRNNNINIFTVIHRMQAVSAQEYRVELSTFMAAKGVDVESEAGRLKADSHRFTVTFVDESSDGEWKVRSAVWQR